MSLEERILNYNMGPNRASVILPPISIYLKIMKLLKANEIQTPIIGLADGIVKKLYFSEYSFEASGQFDGMQQND